MCNVVGENPHDVTKVTAAILATATNHVSGQGLSMSTCVRTRKVVNYSCEGQSQGKP